MLLQLKPLLSAGTISYLADIVVLQSCCKLQQPLLNFLYFHSAVFPSEVLKQNNI